MDSSPFSQPVDDDETLRDEAGIDESLLRDLMNRFALEF